MHNKVFSIAILFWVDAGEGKLLTKLLTSALFTALESPFGNGVYTASATQLANIVIRMSHSNGIKAR